MTPAKRTTQQAALYTIMMVNIAIMSWFWWLGSGHEALASGHGLVTALGRLSGLYGAFAIILEFVFMSRLPLLEQAFGRPLQTKLHKWVGYAAFGFLTLHFTLLTVGYSLAYKSGIIAQFLSFYFTFEDVSNSVLAYILLIVVVGLSVWIVRRQLKYETWFYIHLLSYAAILLAFGHQMKVGADFINRPLFAAYWWYLYILTFLLVAYYRFLMPVWLSWSHRLVVDRVVTEAPSVHSVYIRGRNIASLPYLPGQFAIWRFLHKDYWTEGHPFSLSDQPGTDTVRLTFKESGDFTATLAALTPGTPVLMDGPYGIFTPQTASRPKLLMIAGGIGITPIASMLTACAQRTRDIVLLYAARTEADLALRQELEAAAATYGLKVTYIISDDPKYRGETGILDQEKLARLVPDAAEREVFLCGPTLMMRGVTKSLRNLDTPRNMIHTEDFSF